MRPLLAISDHVEGIDPSDAMLSHAREDGLNVIQGSYEELPVGPYDLISVCMTFHWLDRTRALASFSRASEIGAIWVIYNFAFAGHATDERFNEWLRGWYYQRFPTPRRESGDFRIEGRDAGLEELAHGSGVIPIHLSRPSLIGYLTTQSNVEANLREGLSYSDFEQQIDCSLPRTESEEYGYRYTYTVARYTGA